MIKLREHFSPVRVKKYAVYRGDNLLVVGTSQECADFMGWTKKKTTQYYTSPAYQRKVAKRKNARSYITVIKLEDDL